MDYTNGGSTGRRDAAKGARRGSRLLLSRAGTRRWPGPGSACAAVDWLVRRSVSEREALACVAEAAGLPLPGSREQLRQVGLGPNALSAEVRRARAAGVRTLLAGIELVELEGVTHLEPGQIRADAGAMMAAGAHGLALSWDLWHMPEEFLDLVALS